MINCKNFYYLFLIFIFIAFDANAYIDPGGISAFIQILFASVITSIIFLKSFIKNFFSKFIEFLLDFKTFFKVLTLKNVNFIYCESNSYSIYFYEVLKLFKNRKRNFIYLSSIKGIYF